jgi:hypothetical protein
VTSPRRSPTVAGLPVKDADEVILRLLRDTGALVHRSTIRHSYPFCYRTGTPLIYKAIPTWFVRVERLKDRMVEHNAGSTGFPNTSAPDGSATGWRRPGLGGQPQPLLGLLHPDLGMRPVRAPGLRRLDRRARGALGDQTG